MTEKNPYNKRFNWWYAAIADWMLRNPGGTLPECAASLGRAVNTISMIKNSDMFKEYYAKRRREWEERHDYALRDRLTKVATLGLDIMLDTMEKKRDSVPLKLTTEVVTSALDRLGYSPNAPQTQITVQANGSQVLVAPVTVDRLEEARQVLRMAQQKRSEAPPLYIPLPDKAAEPAVGEMEDEDAPLTISTQ